MRRTNNNHRDTFSLFLVCFALGGDRSPILASGGGGIINAGTNCLNIEKQQRSMFDQEAQKMYQSAASYGVEIDYTVESE